MPELVIDGKLVVATPLAATLNTDEDQLNIARTTATFIHNMNAHAIIVITNFFNESMI